MSNGGFGLSEIDEEMVYELMPARRRGSRKGDNGSVLIVGGSGIYHGAPTLSALAAYRSGVDLVYLAVPEVIATPIRAISPSLIVIPFSDMKLTMGVAQQILRNLPRVDAVAIGPGLSISDSRPLLRLCKGLIERGIKLVLDASALIPEVLTVVRGYEVVLTPHAGEFRRVFGVEVPQDVEGRAKLVSKKAREHHVTVLLKGAIDVVSDGERTYLNRRGTPAMTVGGTGDVLTGIVAALMAKGLSPIYAASIGVYLNCSAGEELAKRVGLHMLPTDLIDELTRVMMRYDKLTD